MERKESGLGAKLTFTNKTVDLSSGNISNNAPKPVLKASFSFNKNVVQINQEKAQSNNENNNNNNNNNNENVNSNNSAKDNQLNSLNEVKAEKEHEIRRSSDLLSVSSERSENRINLQDVPISEEEMKVYLETTEEEKEKLKEIKKLKESLINENKERYQKQKLKNLEAARKEIFANKENLSQSVYIPRAKASNVVKSKEGFLLPPVDNLFSPNSLSQSAYLISPSKEEKSLFNSSKIAKNPQFIQLSTAKDISVKDIINIQQNPDISNQLNQSQQLFSSQKFLTASVQAPRLIEKQFNEIKANLPPVGGNSNLTQSTTLRYQMYVGNLKVRF